MFHFSLPNETIHPKMPITLVKTAKHNISFLPPLLLLKPTQTLVKTEPLPHPLPIPPANHFLPARVCQFIHFHHFYAPNARCSGHQLQILMASQPALRLRFILPSLELMERYTYALLFHINSLGFHYIDIHFYIDLETSNAPFRNKR